MNRHRTEPAIAMNRIQRQHGMSLFEHFQHVSIEPRRAAVRQRTRRRGRVLLPKLRRVCYCKPAE